jgi:TRAP-type uncharacterized transport system substrate-binding protein
MPTAQTVTLTEHNVGTVRKIKWVTTSTDLGVVTSATTEITYQVRRRSGASWSIESIKSGGVSFGYVQSMLLFEAIARAADAGTKYPPTDERRG